MISVLQNFNRAIATATGRIPLRFILVVPFVLIIFTAVALTGWLSLDNGQTAVNDVARQLRNEVTSRIAARLEQFLRIPHTLNAVHVNAFKTEQINVDDRDKLLRHFWTQMQAFPEVYSTYYGDQRTGYAYGGNQFPNVPLQVHYADDSTKGRLNDYSTKPDGTPDELMASVPDFDPRKRPWYQDAKRARKPTWSEIYADFTFESLMITAARPVFNKHKRLQGVVGGDLPLSQLSDFLRDLKVGKNGKTFIMERSGYLVASSSEEAVFANSKRLKATEINDPLIQATANHIQRAFGDIANIKTDKQLEFAMNGSTEFVQVSPWQDEIGLDWVIAVVVPEADFMADINANTRITIWLMVIALVIAIIVGLLTSSWVIAPLHSLSEASKRIANGDWDTQLPTKRSDELGQLAHSFNIMSRQLKDVFGSLEEANTTLEQRVKERTADLAKAYKKLKSSQAQLVQSEKMASLGQMVAGVAHEINTPLGYVKSNVEMTQELFSQTEEMVNAYDALMHTLLSGGEDVDEEMLNAQISEVTEIATMFKEDNTFEETRNLFQDSIYGVEQISELVMNLKDFSRLDQARVDQVSMHDCIDSALNIGKNVVKHKAEIEKHFDPDLPRVPCSPSQINQVFLNMVSNAAQAIGHDHGKITIKTSYDDQFVYVTIQDNGKGIPKDVMAKIFDPFFTTKPIGEGTGLGLSISYQIINQHKGKIKVASQEGKGTKFLICLPRNTEAPATKKQAAIAS